MTIEGELSVFEDKDTTSGSPVLREFCRTCGSPIRSVLVANPSIVAVKAGSLDDPHPFAPQMHIFTRSRLRWIEIADGTPRFDTVPDGNVSAS
jgi:hypothetical protein